MVELTVKTNIGLFGLPKPFFIKMSSSKKQHGHFDSRDFEVFFDPHALWVQWQQWNWWNTMDTKPLDVRCSEHYSMQSWVECYMWEMRQIRRYWWHISTPVFNDIWNGTEAEMAFNSENKETITTASHAENHLSWYSDPDPTSPIWDLRSSWWCDCGEFNEVNSMEQCLILWKT